MQNRLQNFIDKSFGEVRVLLENNEAWFMASDICRALGIKNPWDAVSRLDEDEKMTLGNAEGHSGKRGGAQSFNLVNESGMWKLVLRSRLPQADTLRRWLTHTVIPSIRKNGGYVEGQESLSGEDMQVLRSEIKRLQTQIDARTIVSHLSRMKTKTCLVSSERTLALNTQKSLQNISAKTTELMFFKRIASGLYPLAFLCRNVLTNYFAFFEYENHIFLFSNPSILI